MYNFLIKRANIVLEALPYLLKFHDRTIVIKYGGAAMTDPVLKEGVIRDIVLLKYVGINPVIVHGGGRAISKALKRNKIESEFIQGHRVTTKEAMAVVEKVLGGKVAREIARMVKRSGGKPKILCGKNGRVIKAEKLYLRGVKADLGFAGRVAGIRYRFLNKIMKKGYIPIISPVGIGRRGLKYNINADAAASSIAAMLKAAKLIFLTDVRGVLDKNGKLISEINRYKMYKMVKNETIRGGMIPKVKHGLKALQGGAEKVHIIDGNIPHAILLELFTDHGIGTMVVK
ncbi:MAG: acetylglutamate kinase [Candidatus Saganbacteria bacterium]|nr:acetylglutamate kinase [Candidatus Saganbacteria bacterium]